MSNFEIALVSTAFAGTLGLAATFLANFLQSRSSSKQESLKQARTLKASKTALPLVLSSLVDWVEEIVESLRSLYDQLEPNDSLPRNVNLPDWPQLPRDLIMDLRHHVENENSETVNNRIAEIIRQSQILYSRIDGIGKHPHASWNRNSLDIHVVTAAEVLFLIGSLFEYAREEAEVVSVDMPWQELPTKLLRFRIYDNDYRTAWNRARALAVSKLQDQGAGDVGIH